MYLHVNLNFQLEKDSLNIKKTYQGFSISEKPGFNLYKLLTGDDGCGFE